MLCATSRRNNRSSSGRKLLRSLGKGAMAGWDFPWSFVEINKGMTSSWFNKKALSSDLLLVPNRSKKRRWWILEPQLLAQKTWGLGCPGMWDSLHSGICACLELQAFCEVWTCQCLSSALWNWLRGEGAFTFWQLPLYGKMAWRQLFFNEGQIREVITCWNILWYLQVYAKKKKKRMRRVWNSLKSTVWSRSGHN